jgi:hypothetical protein
LYLFTLAYHWPPQEVKHFGPWAWMHLVPLQLSPSSLKSVSVGRLIFPINPFHFSLEGPIIVGRSITELLWPQHLSPC